MAEPVFFAPSPPLALREAARIVGAEVGEAEAGRAVSAVAPLDAAGPGDLAFLDNPRYLDALRASRAEACLVSPRYAAAVPEGTAALVVKEPYRAFARLAAVLYPAAMRPGSAFGTEGVAPGASVHPAARLEPGVTVDPGAVIGPGAEVGSGTVVAANAVLGPGVRVGRDCAVGPGASLAHCLLGNRVIVGAGARLGGDGFGFAMGAAHLKVPQVGRVVVQDDVEIGANTTIDRGANRDTVIGEGTKIDNLVQIGHNVVVGRHCVIVSGVGISGSAVLEDYVVLGGQVGVVGHLRIGAGAQIAGSSNVATDVPPGVRWGGTPAKPITAWFREIKTLTKLAKRGGGDA